MWQKLIDEKGVRLGELKDTHVQYHDSETSKQAAYRKAHTHEVNS